MGRWLQSTPPQPHGCSFQQSGPGNTCTALRLRPPGLPLRAVLSWARVKQAFMKIRGKTMTLCRSRGESEWQRAKHKAANDLKRLLAPCSMPVRKGTTPLPRSEELASRSPSCVNNSGQGDVPDSRGLHATCTFTCPRLTVSPPSLTGDIL